MKCWWCVHEQPATHVVLYGCPQCDEKTFTERYICYSHKAVYHDGIVYHCQGCGRELEILIGELP